MSFHKDFIDPEISPLPPAKSFHVFKLQKPVSPVPAFAVHYTGRNAIPKVKKGLGPRHYRRSYTLTTHPIERLDMDAQPAFRCQWSDCRESFGTLNLLLNHLERHNEINPDDSHLHPPNTPTCASVLKPERLEPFLRSEDIVSTDCYVTSGNLREPLASDPQLQIGDSCSSAEGHHNHFAVRSGLRARPDSVCALLGDALLERSYSRQWAGYALATRSQEEIETQLGDLLEEFAVELVCRSARVTDPKVTRGDFNMLVAAADIIRCNKRRITRHIHEKLEPSLATSFSSLRELEDLDWQLSLSERFSLLASSGSGLEDSEDTSNHLRAEERFDARDVNADLGLIYDMLVSNDAFQLMASKVRRSLYHDDMSQMKGIRSFLILQPSYFGRRYNVAWDVTKCMNARFGDNIPSIRSAIVLTGSSLYTQATTCEKYVSQTWPGLGTILLEALDNFLKKNQDPVQVSQGMDSLYMNSNSPGNLNISIAGNSIFATEIAQQLAWLGSALSISPFPGKITYARPKLPTKTSIPELHIQFEHEILHPTEETCWLPLFPGAVIASGFPIPNRADETGLEIALGLLAGISGVHHAVEFQGGVVMKGFSHMFVPIRKSSDRIQWHAISSKDPDIPLTYQEGLSQCGPRALLEEVSLEDLEKCRSIVGWCSVAQSRLGSDLANYENIHYSAATDNVSSIKCSKASLGFQQFGTAALDFEFGVTEGKCHFKRDGPYRNIVTWAESTPIVLYDTADRRGWLVPASEVLLHIVQCRHRRGLFEIDGKRIALDTNIAVHSSAKEVLLNRASTKLSDKTEHTFKTEIASIWSLLEFLIAENVAREQKSSGYALKRPWVDFLHGFEFNAVVEEHSPFRQKETRLLDTNGGWPLLSRDIDALVLLANGFEDIIVPAVSRGNEKLCRTWRHAPKGKDFLSTGTPMLQRLYETAGCPLDRTYLTTSGAKLQWHQGNSMLFDPCAEPNRAQCNCERLQKIVPESTSTRNTTPGHLADKGAVIFGRSGWNLAEKMKKPRASVAKISNIYSQDNIPIAPIVTDRDSDEDSFSNGGISCHDGSATGVGDTSGSLSPGTTVSTQDTAVTSTTSWSRKRHRLPPSQALDTDEEDEKTDARDNAYLNLGYKKFKDANLQHELRPNCLAMQQKRMKRVRNRPQEPSSSGKRVVQLTGCVDSRPGCYTDQVPALINLDTQPNEVFDRRYRTTGLPVRLSEQKSQHRLQRQSGFCHEASP